MVDYFSHIKISGVGIDGQLTKAQRLNDALRFIEFEGKVSKEKCAEMKVNLDGWKVSLRKNWQAKRLDALSDEIDVKALTAKFNSETIWREYDFIINMLRKGSTTVDAEDLKFCTAAAMTVLTFENWQRPGALCNATVQEFQNCTQTIMMTSM